jgi:hypothetical protein
MLTALKVSECCVGGCALVGSELHAFSSYPLSFEIMAHYSVENNPQVDCFFKLKTEKPLKNTIKNNCRPPFQLQFHEAIIHSMVSAVLAMNN